MPDEVIRREVGREDGFRYFCWRCGGLGWTKTAGLGAALGPG